MKESDPARIAVGSDSVVVLVKPISRQRRSATDRVAGPRRQQHSTRGRQARGSSGRGLAPVGYRAHRIDGRQACAHAAARLRRRRNLFVDATAGAGLPLRPRAPTPGPTPCASSARERATTTHRSAGMAVLLADNKSHGSGASSLIELSASEPSAATIAIMAKRSLGAPACVTGSSRKRWRDARRLEDQSDRRERDRWTAEIRRLTPGAVDAEHCSVA